MGMKRSRPMAPLAAIVALVFAGPSPAQNILEEITVTAQKREQDLQDVGIAISAFTGDQMRALGVSQSFDVAAFSPGVHISGNLAGQNTQFTIRGVTQNDFNDIVEAPNAVYLDEGYIPIAQAQTFAVFDVDRVEILKGPQGTLFGRNATGGLVHYLSRQPNFDESEGYLDVTYGVFDSDADADHFRVEGAVGGPLSERAAGRVAFLYNQHDGYLENIYPVGAVGGPPGPDAGADLGDDDTLAIRGTLAFQFSDDVSLRLSANFAESDVATGPYQSIPTAGVFDANGELINVINVGPNETRAGIAADGSDFGADVDNNGTFGDIFGRPPGADFFGYIDPDGDDFTTSSDFAFEDQGNLETWGLNAKVEWALSDSTTLTSITDFKDYSKLLFIDVDSAPANQSANYGALDADSFSQEIRVDGENDQLKWVAGFYYLNIDADSDNGLKFPVGSIVPGAPFDLGADAQLQTDSYSLFGQIELALNETVTLTSGLRVIQEEKEYMFAQNIYGTQDSRQFHVGPGFLIGPVFGPNGPEPFRDDTSDTLWAGKVQLDFRPNDDLLWYVGLNRGVKAGSFNAQLAGGLPVPSSAIPYDEEELLSLEAGFKLTVADGTTRINGSAFYYDYSDYQAFLFTGVSGVVVNADAENKGVELEVQTSPFDGFDALFSIAYFDATVENVPLRVGGPIIRDVDPTYAPELQATAVLRYGWDALGGRMSIAGDVSYSDSFFYNLRNFDADQFDSYTMVNARLGWMSTDGVWEAALKFQNLTDERAGIQGFDLATLCGCNEVSYRAPRWVGVSLKYSF